jgi:hypothetical protein
MTSEKLIPVHAEVCKIKDVANVELDEGLTFEANGQKWEVCYREVSELFEGEPPFILFKNGTPIFSFTQPESITTFFNPSK